MVTFLVTYQNSSDAEKIYLESYLAYAIYDYLEDNPKIKSKKLEEIAAENLLLKKNGKTKKFIENLIKKKDKKFIKKINPYLLPFCQEPSE
ncbi:MAG: hypothetical protein WC584_03580 [Candidatus Pacearchaeota archaeon]